jgi:hypothetical protein
MNHEKDANVSRAGRNAKASAMATEGTSATTARWFRPLV